MSNLQGSFRRVVLLTLAVLASPAPADGIAVIPTLYKETLSDGRKVEMWGYLDATGALVIRNLKTARRVSEGLAAVVPFVEGSVEKEYGYVDAASGKLVVPPSFTEANPFSCGLACVQPKGSTKWGYIDRSGTFVIEAKYSQAESFSCDIGRVHAVDGWRYIDKTGLILFRDTVCKVPRVTKVKKTRTIWKDDPNQPGNKIQVEEEYEESSTVITALVMNYKDGDTFSDGLACVSVPVPPEKQAEYRGPTRRLYIDPSGKPVIEKVFTRTTRFFEGMAYVRFLEGGKDKSGFIDKTGTLVIDLADQFTEARPFSDGMAAVRGKDGRWGFIDATGKLAVEPTYSEESDDFHEGLACVVLTGPMRVGYVDKAGKEAILLVAGSSSRCGEAGLLFSTHEGSFQNGLASRNGQIIDRSGKVVWPK